MNIVTYFIDKFGLWGFMLNCIIIFILGLIFCILLEHFSENDF